MRKIEIIYLIPDPQHSLPLDKITGESHVGFVNGGAQLTGEKVTTNGLDQWVDLGNQRGNSMRNLTNCNQGFVMDLWLRMHRYDEAGTYNDEYYITIGGYTDRSMGIALLTHEQDIVYFHTTSKIWELTYASGTTLNIWYHDLDMG